METIKLHGLRTGKAREVNVDRILYFREHRDGTHIQMGYKNALRQANVIRVKETVEEVKKLCKSAGKTVSESDGKVEVK